MIFISSSHGVPISSYMWWVKENNNDEKHELADIEVQTLSRSTKTARLIKMRYNICHVFDGLYATAVMFHWEVGHQAHAHYES